MMNMLMIEGANLGYATRQDENIPNTDIISWWVFELAAFIVNCRRQGYSDGQIAQFIAEAASSSSHGVKVESAVVYPCPNGICTDRVATLAWNHANDPNWKSLPVNDSDVRWQIEDTKAYITNQRRLGRSDRAIITSMRGATDYDTVWGACGNGCDEEKTAEAYRQLDLGYGVGQEPPGTYADTDATAFTTRKVAAVATPSGSAGGTAKPGFWAKHKTAIIVSGGVAALGTATAIVLAARKK